MPSPPAIACAFLRREKSCRPKERDVGYRSIARPLVELIAKHNLPAKVTVLRPPTFDRLREVLAAEKGHFHIVHFDGHGRYGQGPALPGLHVLQGLQGHLLFETGEDDPKPDLVSAEKLRHLGALSSCADRSGRRAQVFVETSKALLHHLRVAFADRNANRGELQQQTRRIGLPPQAQPRVAFYRLERPQSLALEGATEVLNPQLLGPLDFDGLPRESQGEKGVYGDIEESADLADGNASAKLGRKMRQPPVDPAVEYFDDSVETISEFAFTTASSVTSYLVIGILAGLFM
jgi:hypothetical protein